MSYIQTSSTDDVQSVSQFEMSHKCHIDYRVTSCRRAFYSFHSVISWWYRPRYRQIHAPQHYARLYRVTNGLWDSLVWLVLWSVTDLYGSYKDRREDNGFINQPIQRRMDVYLSLVINLIRSSDRWPTSRSDVIVYLSIIHLSFAFSQETQTFRISQSVAPPESKIEDDCLYFKTRLYYICTILYRSL